MCHPAWSRALTEAWRRGELTLLRRVRDRIDREYAEPLDVEALARAARMPAAQLGRRFLLAYGEPPDAYQLTRRVERAMALLRRADLSVAEVRAAVGRPPADAFTARFTELAGVPPADYRRAAGRAVTDRAASCRPERARRGGGRASGRSQVAGAQAVLLEP
ncbi:helix-turn-helix domain-containing protein [Actinomadura sp. 21ATH]|uniref:helix-turn-helix domain-containing protein n=1 Tax=Actinomadura sp. 21ATH TaxID=1735444 RepID=UPI0035C0F7CE